MARGEYEPRLGEPVKRPIDTLCGKISFGIYLCNILFVLGLLLYIVAFKRDPRQPLPSAEVRRLFLRSPSNATLASHLFNLTREPHMAGTPQNMWTAKYVRDKFEEYNLSNVRYADYPVLLSYPVARHLAMVAPVALNLTHREAAIPGDPDSANKDAADLFLAYSPSGSVTAEVVFANYGATADFEALRKLGVNCTGKIVIMRYGAIYRGDKVSNAAAAGAAAALLYSDPQEVAPEGTDPAHVYPRARWLPPSGGQRGSIYPYAGDPETPGWPSTPEGERLREEDSRRALPRIPAMPLAYSDAAPILRRLGGQVAPREWWGGIPRQHHNVGPGPVVLAFDLQMNTTVRTIRNVIASIEGTEEPDRYVVLGNHRDAWAFGAVDPNSGTACMLALAEAFGKLRRAGWRPRRSVVLASWDAEEYALIGSTEWVEGNEGLLGAQAVAYVNVDVAVGGPGFAAEGTPQLDNIIWEVAKQVADPDNPKRTVYEEWMDDSWSDNASAPTRPKVGRLGGGGSDYGAFLQHIGVPSLNFEYGAKETQGYAVYHSLYDDFKWMADFGDVGFHRHVACAQLWGLVVLRLADDAVLSFDYERYAEELSRYASAVDGSLLQAMAARDDEADPSAVSVAPLHAAITRFAEASAVVALQAQPLRERSANGEREPKDPAALRLQRSVNERMLLAERAFLDPQGLGGLRTWYRHMVYAPAIDDGYGSVAFPGVTDAIGFYKKGAEGASLDLIQHEIFRVARAVDRAAAVLRGTLL